jgi:hypothetical protein
MGITMRASLFASVAEPLPLLSIDALALKSPSSEPKPQRSFMQSIFGSSEPNVLEARTRVLFPLVSADSVLMWDMLQQ